MDLIITTAITLFIVIDPFGNLAAFHKVLSSCPEKDRSKILLREMLIALVVLMSFLFWGQNILDFLKLETPALQITSGVILFIISIGLIFPAKSVLGGEHDTDPFIVPLAIPLIAGPATLIPMLLFASRYGDRIGEIALATFLAWFVSTLILLAAPTLMKFLGDRGARALERLMGMLLIMIAIQVFLDGLGSFLNLPQ